MLIFAMGAYFFAERATQRSDGAKSVASSEAELHPTAAGV
jgi:hypothetical protein